MANNYDRVSGIYDRLSRLIFGQSIVRAQRDLLPHLASPCNLLIVGGGTGWILEELAALHPAGFQITYVELSAKMVHRARERNAGDNRVHFVLGDIEELSLNTTFDAVMTPFLFDNFKKEKANAVFQKLDSSLKPNGLWLFTDFQITSGAGRFWQKPLLRGMYLFFRLISHIETSELPDMQQHLIRRRYHALHTRQYFGKFIFSGVFIKK